MASVTVVKQINAPLDRVFALFADIPNAAKNIDGITRVEMLTEGAVGVGTRFRETRKMYGKESTEEMEFTAFDEDRHYTVEAHSHGSHYISTFDFEATDGGTQVTTCFSATPQSFMARLLSFLGSMMIKSVAKILEQDMDDIKRLAESESS